MGLKLSKELKEAMENKVQYKTIVTIGKEGKLQAQKVHTLYVTETETLLYPEYLESSQTNKNLIYSLWFNQEVVFLIEDAEASTYEVRGIPRNAIIEGAYFEEEYRKVQAVFDGRFDLSTIWEIEIISVKDITLEKCARKEQEAYPMIQHLDRIAKE